MLCARASSAARGYEAAGSDGNMRPYADVQDEGVVAACETLEATGAKTPSEESETARAVLRRADIDDGGLSEIDGGNIRGTVWSSDGRGTAKPQHEVTGS